MKSNLRLVDGRIVADWWFVDYRELRFAGMGSFLGVTFYRNPFGVRHGTPPNPWNKLRRVIRYG